jgi:hypothetical protein
VCEGKDWIHLAQDGFQWRALVNTVINLRVKFLKGWAFLDKLSNSQLPIKGSAPCSLLFSFYCLYHRRCHHYYHHHRRHNDRCHHHRQCSTSMIKSKLILCCVKMSYRPIFIVLFSLRKRVGLCLYSHSYRDLVLKSVLSSNVRTL